MLGIIRVLSTDNENILMEHGTRMKELYQIASKTKCIGEQPNGIYDNESEAAAIPKIVSLAKELSQERDIDAITISCAADPALDEARLETDIPIIGAGVSGAHAARMVGSKVGIIGITQEAPIRMKEELGSRFHAYTSSPKLSKTTDLFKENAKQELLTLVHEQIESGADVILFACTGFSTIRLKNYLQKRVKIPVIDLVEAQAIAYQLIESREKDEE
ncbi:aspartate/glutamate racemase family protein [Oceanobacillus sp. FSL W7-1293]|uniref:aspartate/glutamate racemase family protein n=1 Tax=Oceanobacillus sp. FSL W7-1293 TaxID=2921699 RepID=UPI0030D29B64